MCYSFGLAGARPIIRGTLDAVAHCPVGCRASQSLASTGLKLL
jgi:hypothetical protein